MGYNSRMETTEPRNLDDAACYQALRTRDARFDGRFFTAVLSTGIYCRPVCPARTPKRENVRFYAYAAAAQEAGFRPCLRCRPETSPGSTPWLGTTITVSRALRLIADGALDSEAVGALATRLGVGERHLRRLFLRHLGTTPRTLGQTRRLAFAKKLIDETRLPVGTVAAAAGFRSLRRFHTAFRQAYRQPPRALRRRSALSPRDSSSDLTLRLPFRPPFDWDGVLRFLSARAVPGLEAAAHGRYRRSLRIGEQQALVQIEPVRGEHHLLARIRLADATLLLQVVERLRRLFDLDADPEAIARHLRRDPRLAPRLRRRPGVRLPGSGDPFEAAVRAILGQQVSVAAATRLVARLAERHGEPLTLDQSGMEEIRFVFPSPQRLAAADPAGFGCPRARGETLVRFARAVADGRISFQPASLSAFVESLCALPGVGPWTAHTVALRALGEPDAFPAGDLGLRRALGSAGRLATPRHVEAAAESWRPWRAYAAMTLWNGGSTHADAKH